MYIVYMHAARGQASSIAANKPPLTDCLHPQHTFKTSVAEDAPEFSPYLRDPDILATALKDANAVAQESAILCTCAFVEYAGKNAASTSKEALTSAIVEKNILGSARAGTKKAATELCLLLVECDNSADVVIEACIQGLKSKQPKAVAGAVAVLKEIVRSVDLTGFGRVALPTASN